ncbi:MAG: dihydroorotate dehydrogenase electron transfer subunit [Treponema sp.]|jgi:NAD(P)H-flavin reductase|nr:dihydroorotate dehydrogenase electron transfer subunit [Treponema sp.]
MNCVHSASPKQSLLSELLNINPVTSAIFRMDFMWSGAEPKAGQFFMVRPARGSVFLGRPISLARWNPVEKTITFLIARRGTGTAELAAMHTGEAAELTGPLGNTWAGCLPAGTGNGKPIALIGGGIGIAPLEALAAELSGKTVFDFYAGFRTGFRTPEEKTALLGPALLEPRNCVMATEDGSEGSRGRIPGFLEAKKYSAVCACGPEPMMKAAMAQCIAAGTPCFISMERRMACGVGACLGCTVKTADGNRRCCADGPIFSAAGVIFDE